MTDNDLMSDNEVNGSNDLKSDNEVKGSIKIESNNDVATSGNRDVSDDDSNLSEVFEDAETSDETNPQLAKTVVNPVPRTPRHSTRSNFGVPASRYGFDEFDA